MTCAIIFGLSLIILVVFTITVYLPLRKIAAGANEYAAGNLNYRIKVKTHDEMGYLSNTLNYMSDELNKMEEYQRNFIANVSHDFRSPLTSIKGYVEAMLDGTIPPEMQEKYLNIILFETERLNKLTKSLLELNKFGSHGVMLDVTDFDINQTIKTTLLTFEGICANKHIRFNLILSGEQLFVTADFSKIQQVLYNLIDNAIKFSHQDSTITIETTEKNDKVFVSVKDTGIGIPKDSLKKIWERFYKTDLSRGKDKRGTGLGLSIVKEIIQAHGENINCISTEGVGTEFIFTLPIAKDKE
jgi:signal transduction histidine kinase